MPLYEVAILEVPTKKEIEEGTGEEKLVLGPKCCVAKEPQAAAIKCVLENVGEVSKIDKSRMAVLVRPFV